MELRDALLKAARDSDAMPTGETAYGSRYIIDFDWPFSGRIVPIRRSWIIESGSPAPRLTSCYVR